MGNWPGPADDARALRMTSERAIEGCGGTTTLARLHSNSNMNKPLRTFQKKPSYYICPCRRPYLQALARDH